MTALIQLVNASVTLGGSGRRPGHGVLALAGVSVTIHSGERVALVGANGSGKSTLLRLLHGLLNPSQGDAIRDTSARQAMLFQQPYLLRMSVLANLAIGIWLTGQNWKEARRRAGQALERVGLSALAQRNARKLSGGQRQRVAMARVLALEPDVWFLDEPTASLDPHAKAEVEALIDALARAENSATLVFASHNLGQVKRLASRVIYLEQGRVLADLPVQAFFDAGLLEAQHPRVLQFLKGEFS